MKTLDLNEVKNVRVWEKGERVRLYFDVNGMSAYQHKKGLNYVEFVNNEWVGNRLTKDYCCDLLESLKGLTLEEVKELI